MNTNATSPIASDLFRDLREMAGPDYPALIRKLIEGFLAYGARQIDAMKAAAGIDPGGLGQAAHALRGSAGNMKAFQLKELCARLERHAPTAGALDAVDMVCAVEAEFFQVELFLKAELQGMEK